MKSLATFEDAHLAAIANRLFVFDMDGTLLMRTTACIEIAKVSGTLDQLHILEQQFAAGEIDAFCFARNIGVLWGMVDERVVRTAFEATPKLANQENSESQGQSDDRGPVGPFRCLASSGSAWGRQYGQLLAWIY